MRRLVFLVAFTAVFVALPLGSRALPPVATCTFAGSAVSGTITMANTRASASAPYGYGTNWTFALSGDGLSNNTWSIREWAPTSTRTCADLGRVYIDMSTHAFLNSDTASFTTTDAKVIGPESIIGRSIVVYDIADDVTPIACCAILIQDGDVSTLPELNPAGSSTLEATCTLQQPSTANLVVPITVSGTVKFSTMSTTVVGYDEIGLSVPPYHWGSRIDVNVNTNATAPLDFHIHEYPISTPDRSCGDASTGGHYNPDDGLNIVEGGTLMGLSELSNKHGDIPLPFNGSVVPKTFVDHGVRLDGQFGVSGRSIVIHSNEDGANAERVACCTIPFVTNPVPAIGPTEDIEAICELPPGLDVSGTFYFRQPSGAGQMGVEIIAKIAFNSPVQQGGPHDWRIFERSSGTNYNTGECETSGAPFAPSWEKLGPEPSQIIGGTYATGHLGFKNGFLAGDQNGAEVVFHDGGLALSGPKSVIGRALRVYPAVGSPISNAIGCCNIVRVPPGTARPKSRVATCDFGSNWGTITLTQNHESQGAELSFMLTGDVGQVSALVVHRYGTMSSCNSTGAPWDPVDGYSDITSRIGPISASGTIRDYDLRLSGAYSILGRSLVLLGGANDTLACCTVGLTSGSDPEVRFRYAGAEATCSFSDDIAGGGVTNDGLEGWIRFRQLTHPDEEYMNLGTEIEVNLIGPLIRSTPGAKNLRVMNGSRIASCSDTGPIFEPEDGLLSGSPYTAGRLGAKHGNFTSDRMMTRFIDNSISLYGPHSVLDRSVMIFDEADQPILCCNINRTTLKTHPKFVTPSFERTPSKAACEFNDPLIKGTIVIDDNGSEVRISSNSKGFMLSGAQLGDHNYHIHLYGTTTISAVSGHYRPYDGIGPDANGVPFTSTGIVEIGDLSGKHGKLRHAEYFSYVDNQVQLGGPFSVLGRSIVIHALDGAPYTSCVIKAVDRANYFPPSIWPITVKPCVPGTTQPYGFTCQGGSYNTAGDVIIPDDSVARFEGFVYEINGGITIHSNSTLTVQDVELNVASFVTVSVGATLNLRIVPGVSTARMDRFQSYGGMFNIVDSRFTIASTWEEPVCKARLTPTAPPSDGNSTPTPTGTAVIYPLPITVISPTTNVSVGTVFSPCGHLQIDLKGGSYSSPFVPFTYQSLEGRFTEISYFNSGLKSCEKLIITPMYNATRMSIAIEKDSSKCEQGETNLYIIIGIVVAAIVVAIVVTIVVIAVTPAGIPCRIWYRRTCGAKFSQSGRNTQGF